VPVVVDGRPERVTYSARVKAVRSIRPRVVSVTFTGPGLKDLPSPSPGGHLRLFFGEGEPPGNEARYLRRTFTPRRFDPSTGDLEIEIVLHGSGVAADWARTAAPGDPVVISGAGGRYRPAAVDGRFVIAVDDTGVPAAGTVIEALPATTAVTVLCEVSDADDERPVADRDVAVEWLHRDSAGAQPGALLEARVRDLPADLAAGWFVASESRVVRRIHGHLLDERGAPSDDVEARGYWRQRDP
jgi:NADPH-dependent ferric siderophore reductase